MRPIIDQLFMYADKSGKHYVAKMIRFISDDDSELYLIQEKDGSNRLLNAEEIDVVEILGVK